MMPVEPKPLSTSRHVFCKPIDPKCLTEEEQDARDQFCNGLDFSAMIKLKLRYFPTVLVNVFKYKPLADSRVLGSAKILKEAILKKILNPNFKIVIQNNESLAKQFRDDYDDCQPEDFTNVWGRGTYEPYVPWHKIIRQASIEYEEGMIRFNRLSPTPFRPGTLMGSLYNPIDLILKDLKIVINDGIHLGANENFRSKIPAAAKMIHLIGHIADLLTIVNPPEIKDNDMLLEALKALGIMVPEMFLDPTNRSGSQNASRKKKK